MTSVDGLDIMTGKTASKEGGGYVLTPALSPTDNDIPGFRLNNSEVAAFHFGDRRDSYAAQLDKPANVGVIAVIFYEERPRFRHTLSMSPRGGCLGGGLEGTRGGGTFGPATKGGVGHDMGTEFGQRTEHRVNTTQFDRGREVARFVIEIFRSDDRGGLIGLSTSQLIGVALIGAAFVAHRRFSARVALA